MDQIKVKVRKKVILVDPFNADPKYPEKQFTLDNVKMGKEVLVPDSQFWRGKISERYLDFVADVPEESDSAQDEGPWDGFTKTQLEQVAADQEPAVDLKGCKNKADIIGKLEEAKVEPPVVEEE